MRRNPGAQCRVLAQRLEAEALGLQADDQWFEVGWRPGVLARPDTQVRQQNIAGLDFVQRLLQQLFVAELLARQFVTQESGWDTSAESPVGAQGISQFMPGTWGESGLDGDGDGIADVWNPIDSIWSQGNYMCNLAGQVDKPLSQGSILGDPLDLTLAAYNAGFGNVKKYGGIPPFKETENYVQTIRENAANASIGGAGGTPSGPVQDGVIMPTISKDGTYLRSPKGVKSGLLPESVLCGWKSFQLRCEAANGFEDLNQAYRGCCMNP